MPECVKKGKMTKVISYTKKIIHLSIATSEKE